MRLPEFGIFYVRTESDAFGDLTGREERMNTTRESALKVDFGRKIPHLTRDSNPRQYCVELFYH